MSNRPNHRESEQEVLNEARNATYGAVDTIVQVETTAGSATAPLSGSTRGSKNVASVEIVDGSGNQITSFGSSTVTASQGTASATEKWGVSEQALAGTGTTGTLALTSANTWYACPSTAPSNPYVLIATIENAAGTVRLAFSNGTTPSATFGNLAPSQLIIRLAASQVVYFASSTSGDDVNWTCKEIS